ncbi:uncharacterized protein LOC105847267 isoform X1 [Hydra vulgaris]|uniref:uncharacterized protein LOC105847267 isoform X1 n=1 Tax=Hydra vulgaris TaxID=6087 RepID=UPI001F5EB9E0|nr:uncharacterized protein LOC105847267 isoform X1 [Hydra vulgaris]XP_047129483.1 uncharacterized protein LOC105847267 isoform X1 [Hydra vulgaris]XP_047129490.1 uncharacterized protein LOC105847267 isoform X1 [Hydra vulgaris]
MAASDPIGAEQVAATVLASKSASPHGTIRFSQPCVKLLPLRKEPSSAQQLFKEPLTTQNMVQIQQNIGLSNNGMRKLGSVLNQISPIRLVEPSFQQKFAQAGQKLCDHFTVSSITLAENNQISQVVHCQYLSSLSDVFLASKKMTDSAILKLGIDGGGSFLKVSFTHIIVDEGETPLHSPLQKTIKLMSPQTTKSTCVKQQLLVAIAQNTPENYHNVKAIFDIIQVQEKCQMDSLVISCDLKLANILCGIQSHSSKHPCCWCDVSSLNLQNCGSPRTFGEIRRQHFEFINAGGDTRKSKEFKNIIHVPLVNFPDHKLVLEAIPPMELHLLLGVVNHLYKNLCKIWPGAEKWPASLRIPIQPYHGGHFNGNDCMKLLRGLDKLQLVTGYNNFSQAHDFMQPLALFKDVVISCFGNNLDPDYESKISKFKQSYIRLPISVIPKVHAVFYHVPQFIKIKKTGLGLFSEQATEALHSNFKVHWERYKRDSSHLDYASQLLKCVIKYNSK